MIQVMKAQNGYEKWCDDVRTPAKETCAMQSAKAFDLAGAYLKKHYGRRSQWRWGSIHVAAGDHRPFSFVPVVSRFFSVTPETPGDGFTVDVGHFFIRDEDRPFANRHAASMRAIYDWRTSSDRSSSTRPASRAIFFRRGIRTWPSAGRRSST